MVENEITARLREAIEDAGLSWSSAAQAIGLSPQAPTKWKKGQVGRETVEKLANLTRYSYSYLLTGEGPKKQSAQPTAKPYALIPVEAWDDDTPLDDDTVEVPIYKSAEFSSGPGRSQDLVIDEGMRLRYGKRTLRNNGVEAAQVAGGLNKGRSNEPVFPDGCIVLMDLSKTEIVEGEPYGLEHLGEFRVKQLYRLPGGGLRLRSYNRDEYPDEDYGADWPEQIRIVGWVWIHQPKARKWKGK